MFSVELTLSDKNGETYKVTDSTSDRWTPVWFYSSSGKLKCQDHDYRRCPHILAVLDWETPLPNITRCYSQ